VLYICALFLLGACTIIYTCYPENGYRYPFVWQQISQQSLVCPRHFCSPPASLPSKIAERANRQRRANARGGGKKQISSALCCSAVEVLCRSVTIPLQLISAEED